MAETLRKFSGTISMPGMEMPKADWPGAAMTIDEANRMLAAADKLRNDAGGDGYARTLHAVALKRACDEALAA